MLNDASTATGHAAKPATAPVTTTDTAPATAPATALAAARQRSRKRRLRTVATLLAVCVGIALLLTVIGDGNFWVQLGYSLAIGVSCTTIYELSWLGQSWLHDRLRALRKLPASPGPYVGGWAGVLTAAALCVLLGPPLGQAVASWFFDFRMPSPWDLSNSNTRTTLVISALATMVLIIITSAAERLSAARAAAEAAQRQAVQTQLRLLQSQLEPHMLFNTLANLRVLIGMEPARAQVMLDHMIAFLRATLQASQRSEHPLADEFARINDYLALMNIRMGPRLHVTLDLPAALRSVLVPPLLLQPLVENSIQHGLEPKIEGGQIHISATREGDTLLLRVVDTGIGRDSAVRHAAASPALTTDPSRSGSGFGLSGVRERLATLYGARASLELVDAANGGTEVSVRLPIVLAPSVNHPATDTSVISGFSTNTNTSTSTSTSTQQTTR